MANALVVWYQHLLYSRCVECPRKHIRCFPTTFWHFERLQNFSRLRFFSLAKCFVFPLASKKIRYNSLGNAIASLEDWTNPVSTPFMISTVLPTHKMGCVAWQSFTLIFHSDKKRLLATWEFSVWSHFIARKMPANALARETPPHAIDHVIIT